MERAKKKKKKKRKKENIKLNKICFRPFAFSEQSSSHYTF